MKRFFAPKKIWIALFLLLLVSLLFLFLRIYSLSAPPLDRLDRFPSGLILQDADGEILRVSLGADDQDCRPFYRVNAQDWIVQAVVASEDKHFFAHSGVDLLAIVRACWLNLTSGDILSGASTITMQTMRLLSPHSRTYFWKAVEAVQALRTERVLSKEEILRQYLNRAPFGSNLVGIEAGAQGWFGKPADQLHLGEAALLAGLLQSPTRFRPDRYLDRALKRRDYVLEQMLALQMITPAEMSRAKAIPLRLTRAPRPFRDPYFCDWAAWMASRGDRIFRTTLNRTMQNRLQKSLDLASRNHSADYSGVILDVKRGAVLAMTCTGDYFSKDAGQVNTATAPRPAGSTLKPFIYARALDAGFITPRSLLADVPIHYRNDAPMNFSEQFMGPVSAKDSLILSLNLPAIQLLEKIGQERFLGDLRKMGLRSLSRPASYYGLGLALGNGSVSLLRLSDAYACLARGGRYFPCTPFLEQAEEERKGIELYSPSAAWLVAEMLSGEERSQNAIGHRADVDLPRFAWKTGTSSGYRDAWTIAWNPEYVVGVWCGLKSGARTDARLVGIRSASPVVWELVRALYSLGNSPWYTQPEEIEVCRVCARSGDDPNPLCPHLVQDFRIRRCSSRRLCTVHQMNEKGEVGEVWPPLIAEWLAGKRGIPSSGNPKRIPLQIVYPADETHFQLLDGFPQKIVIQTTQSEKTEPLYWFCNDRFLQTLNRSEPLVFPLSDRGKFRITCSALSGESASIEILVEE